MERGSFAIILVVILFFSSGVFLLAGTSNNLSGKIAEVAKNIFSDFQNFVFQLSASLASFSFLEKSFITNQENDETASNQLEAEGELENEEAFEEMPELSEPEIKAEEENLTEHQEILDDLAEKIDEITSEVDKLVKEQEILNAEKEEEEDKLEEEEEAGEEENEDDEEAEEEVEQDMEQISCQKTPGDVPARNKVIFNEIAWMGTTISANDEWVELKNISSGVVNLTGWQILDKEVQIKIIFSDKEQFSGNSFYLLERTDDDSVSIITADKIYKGALGDDNEALYLFDANCQLQDEVIVESNWPAGDKTSKKTMERKADTGWQTSLDVGGTPRKENSIGYIVPPPTGGGGGGGGSTPPPPTYSKLLISEVQIAGTADEKEEFVELYNPTENDIDLTSWYLQKKTKTEESFSTYTPNALFSGKKIKAKDYFLIARESSSFANSADILTSYSLAENNTLAFKNPNQEIVDKLGWGLAQDFESVATENPPDQKSIGRKWSVDNQNYPDTENNSTDFEIQDPTPKAQNQSPVAPPPPAPDTVPPTVVFDAVSSLQTTLSFILSWIGEDLAPAGVIPSGIDGFQLRYSESEENWTYFPSDTLYTSETQYNFTGQDEKTYNFQIKAKDKNSNESGWTSVSIEINTLPVVINEIAWMGTSSANSADEWIELYNNTNQSLNLDSWQLKASDGTPEINLTGIIIAKGFYLLERTDDYTISDISRDQIYTGALKNEGEKLELKDNMGNIIDLVDSSTSWFAGKDNPDYITMERINPRVSGNNATNWADNNGIQRNGLDASGSPINGTPKTQNSVFTP